MVLRYMKRSLLIILFLCFVPSLCLGGKLPAHIKASLAAKGLDEYGQPTIELQSKLSSQELPLNSPWRKINDPAYDTWNQPGVLDPRLLPKYTKEESDALLKAHPIPTQERYRLPAKIKLGYLSSRLEKSAKPIPTPTPKPFGGPWMPGPPTPWWPWMKTPVPPPLLLLLGLRLLYLLPLHIQMEKLFCW